MTINQSIISLSRLFGNKEKESKIIREENLGENTYIIAKKRNWSKF